jgi:hypothetical protein
VELFVVCDVVLEWDVVLFVRDDVVGVGVVDERVRVIIVLVGVVVELCDVTVEFEV